MRSAATGRVAVTKINDTSPNIMAFEYLIHSYLYYRMDESIVPDEVYDKLCVDLIEVLPLVDKHWRQWLTIGNLAAGTGFNIHNYPDEVRNEALKRLDEHRRNRTDVPYADRGVSVDPEKLYKDLSILDVPFLRGLAVDYSMFLSGAHRRMALEVVSKLLTDKGFIN